jgi:hypothetical protein
MLVRGEIKILEEQIALERAEKRELHDRLQSVMFPGSFNLLKKAAEDESVKSELKEALEQLYEHSS